MTQIQPDLHAQFMASLNAHKLSRQPSSTVVPSSSNIDLDSDSKKRRPEPVASEEDKRRRNTEASARFRAKKKAREEGMRVLILGTYSNSAIANTAREMAAKVEMLEKKVAEQQMEIGWLRGLITDREREN
jgi:Basic region leucine zipper